LSAEKSFENDIQNFWNQHPSTDSSELKCIQTIIEQNQTEISNGFFNLSVQREFAEQLKFLKNCQKKNLPFELMRYYLLFDSDAVSDGNDCNINMLECIKPVSGFYIDLKTLNENSGR